MSFVVIDSDVSTILGKESCESTGLIRRIKQISVNNNELFDGIGCYKNFTYDIDLIENPKFEIYPARRIPHSIRNNVKAELDSMVKNGVIRFQKEPTEAVSPMVVVKKGGKIRICLDTTDLNKNVRRRHFPLTTLEQIAARIHGSKFFTKLDCAKGFWQIKLSEKS